jgi:hypothetical protein
MLENKNMKFNLFESQNCRDTRNQSAHGFVAAVEVKNMVPFEKKILALTSETIPVCIKRLFRTPGRMPQKNY